MRLVTCLVENPLVAELLEIELEALQLHALPAGNVGESQGAEVRLARLRAHRGELRADDLDGIIPAGVLIVEGLQDVAETRRSLAGSFPGSDYCGMRQGLRKGDGDDSGLAGQAKRPAVVLLSGGLDSATTAAIARQQGFDLYALSVDYGQRHRFELAAARRVARRWASAATSGPASIWRRFGGSALTGARVPKDRDAGNGRRHPRHLRPARNTSSCRWRWPMPKWWGRPTFSWASMPSITAAIPIAGPSTSPPSSGWPTWPPRPASRDACSFTIHTPLIRWTKAQIIRRGTELGVDYGLTHTCYDPGAAGDSCGRCDACQLRRKGFAEAGLSDPLRYQTAPGG